MQRLSTYTAALLFYIAALLLIRVLNYLFFETPVAINAAASIVIFVLIVKALNYLVEMSHE